MTTQILDGTGTLRTVSNVDDYIATNPVGSQPFAAARAIAPSITTDVTKARITSAATVNNTLISAAARALRSLDVYNEAAYTVYFKLYDKATAPIAGTDIPFWTIPVPTNSGYSRVFTWGLPLTNGLGFAITKNKPDSDITAVAVNDLVGMLTWR